MSYYELLIAERRRRCLEAMNDNPEIMGKQLMGMLGYTEINSFYRAYKQWTGTNFNCAGKKWQPTLLPICNHCGGLGRRVQG